MVDVMPCTAGATAVAAAATYSVRCCRCRFALLLVYIAWPFSLFLSRAVFTLLYYLPRSASVLKISVCCRRYYYFVCVFVAAESTEKKRMQE